MAYRNAGRKKGVPNKNGIRRESLTIRALPELIDKLNEESKAKNIFRTRVVENILKERYGYGKKKKSCVETYTVGDYDDCNKGYPVTISYNKETPEHQFLHAIFVDKNDAVKYAYYKNEAK